MNRLLIAGILVTSTMLLSAQGHALKTRNSKSILFYVADRTLRPCGKLGELGTSQYFLLRVTV